MKRTTKSPDERRAEIVEAAMRLFAAEGFAEVPVSRIVGEIDVAQGTFYYYFSTKEEVLDAAIEGYLGDLESAFDAIAAEATLDPREALALMVRTEMSYDLERARALYAIQGCDIHMRIFSRLTSGLAPRYQAMIERGVASGAFRTPVPDLIAETIILHVHFLFDREVLGWSEADYDRRLTAAARLIEVLLELPSMSLYFNNSLS